MLKTGGNSSFQKPWKESRDRTRAKKKNWKEKILGHVLVCSSALSSPLHRRCGHAGCAQCNQAYSPFNWLSRKLTKAKASSFSSLFICSSSCHRQKKWQSSAIMMESKSPWSRHIGLFFFPPLPIWKKKVPRCLHNISVTFVFLKTPQGPRMMLHFKISKAREGFYLKSESL